MRVCDDDWIEPLSAWIDGELDPAERARVDAHLARCSRCAAEARTLEALGSALRASAERTKVPPHIVANARALTRPRSQRWPWAIVAAVAVAAAAFLAFGAQQAPLGRALTEELVAHHLRGFARTRPCELESNDPEAVRAWVEEHLGYSVDVPTPAHAELIGARACSIEGRRTAALLYRYESAPMTIFVPPPGSDAVASASRFASRGGRCTEGPIGERICVSDAAPNAFAVADLPEHQMLSMLAR